MLSGHAISTEVLPSVTVVGAKEGSATQKSIIEAGKEVREIPGGASIVDMQTVKQGRVSTWVDSLGLAPGVFVQEIWCRRSTNLNSWICFEPYLSRLRSACDARWNTDQLRRWIF